ncbi:MAG: large conductance mechanosensitive channel protein MscL [Oscillospiraceae bacterium]|nr:large conductance mechanosensitive channel protein MscL [Oscillospiraceae bacterium]
MMQEFEEFAIKGNAIDLAVGVVIGGAFSKIVSSLVSDVFMPLLGRITGGIDVSGVFLSLDGKAYPTLAAAQSANAPVLSYGMFLQNVIDFFLVAFCIFIFLRYANKLLRRKPASAAAPPRLCPFCRMQVDPLATRCPHCTSPLGTEIGPTGETA